MHPILRPVVFATSFLLPIGTAAAQTPFGSGCAGASGITPEITTSAFSSSAQRYSVEVVAPGGIGLGYLIIGLSDTTASALLGAPLPLDIGTFFLDPLWTGCPLNTDPVFLMPYSFDPGSAGGAWSIEFDGFDTGAVFMQALNVDADFVTRIAGISGGVRVEPVVPEPGMVAIEPGSFEMGSDAPSGAPYFRGRDETVHTVSIAQRFWMGSREVTQQEYEDVMGTNPSAFVGSTKPVESVTWTEAMAYCQALTLDARAQGSIPPNYEYRLPTEAEWEYACRAGLTTEFGALRGDGVLREAVPIASGVGWTEALALADLDGDGDVDIVACDPFSFSSDVAVLLNLGDGSFAPASNYGVGSGANAIAIGDLDGDGVPDLVTANKFDFDVSVLLGVGDGSFAPQARYSVDAGAGFQTSPCDVDIADLDGDGAVDLVTANRDSDDVSVLLGVGDGTFGTATAYPTYDPLLGHGYRPASLVVADVNGDAKLDIATADTGSSVTLLSGFGDGTFAPPTWVSAAGTGRAIVAAELDAVPGIDLATTEYLFGQVFVPVGPTGTYAVGVLPTGLAVGDLDGNGLLDLLTSNIGSDDVSVLLATGTGSFAPEVRYPVGRSPYALAIADLDGDGLDDVVTTENTSNGLSVLFGAADGAVLRCSDARFSYSFHQQDGCGSASGPTNVGSFAPNAWGLFDMHGNVSEWCLDTYAPYAPGPSVDPLTTGGASRVVRGGSWLSDSSECRSARRDSALPAATSAARGFRVVLAPNAVP